MEGGGGEEGGRKEGRKGGRKEGRKKGRKEGNIYLAKVRAAKLTMWNFFSRSFLSLEHSDWSSTLLVITIITGGTTERY